MTQNVPVSSPGIIIWSLFSTLSSAIDKLICSKLTSHPKHRTAGNSFFSYYYFFLIWKKVFAKVLKIAVFFRDLNFDCWIQTANCCSFQKNYFTWSCQDFFIVVVIMSANHSKCPRFEPGHNHLVMVFHIVISNRQINMQ